MEGESSGIIPTSINVLMGALSGWVASEIKGRIAKYRIKRDADLKEKKIQEEADLAKLKYKEDSAIAVKQYDIEEHEKLFERYEKILEGEQARMEVERKRFSDAIQRFESRVASLENEVSQWKDKHHDCLEVNSKLLIEINHLKNGAQTSRVLIDDTQNRLNKLEEGIKNGGEHGQ